jgi:hypothetical protein
MENFDFTTRVSVTLPRVNLKNPKKNPREKVLEKLEKGKREGAEALRREVERRLERSISSSTWSWPNTTARTNGSTVSTPRNIVDTGSLLSAQVTTLRISKNKFTIKMTNTVPYARLVHYGGVVRPYGNNNADSVLIPARPWVMAVFEGTYGQERLDVLSFMAKYFKV